jgi:hypothetical protein
MSYGGNYGGMSGGVAGNPDYNKSGKSGHMYGQLPAMYAKNAYAGMDAKASRKGLKSGEDAKARAFLEAGREMMAGYSVDNTHRKNNPEKNNPGY